MAPCLVTSKRHLARPYLSFSAMTDCIVLKFISMTFISLVSAPLTETVKTFIAYLLDFFRPAAFAVSSHAS